MAVVILTAVLTAALILLGLTATRAALALLPGLATFIHLSVQQQSARRCSRTTGYWTAVRQRDGD
ncbi:hypothetical protein [Deinococcus sp. S9]|uniref:hypothetical protein n=1 Tax=Deinococcus sp. S9 TaxID=2545754 RepID=UPI0010558182|nr:hypothetical protein [Deinococcus sp. S9]TDE84829.1 hypothetical protein E0686_15095 [Deinococcus sp. S9]